SPRSATTACPASRKAPSARPPGPRCRAGPGAAKSPSAPRSGPSSGPAGWPGTTPARASAGSAGRASRSCRAASRAALCHRLKSLVNDAARTRQPAVATTPDDGVMNDVQTLIDLVSSLEIGSATTAGNLALLPLLANHRTRAAGLPHYLLYQQAQDMGLISIEEVSEAGTVGALRVVNRADRPV